jgi:hypothetical protein
MWLFVLLFIGLFAALLMSGPGLVYRNSILAKLLSKNIKKLQTLKT